MGAVHRSRRQRIRHLGTCLVNSPFQKPTSHVRGWFLEDLNLNPIKFVSVVSFVSVVAHVSVVSLCFLIHKTWRFSGETPPFPNWSLDYTPSLFCRKLLLISHPTSCQLERHDFLEIVQCLEHLLQGHLLLRPALPLWLVQCPKHQVIVAHDFRHLFGEKGCKKMFQVVLVCNEQITVGAVAARLVEREYLHWIHMDHQWQLPLVHLVVTLRALRKPHVLIGIEKEAVLRGLLPKLCCSFLFPIGHCYVATP